MGAQMIDSVNIPNFSNLKRNLFCQDFRSDLETYLATYVKNDTLQTIEDIIRIGTKSAFTAEQIELLAKNLGKVDNHKMACLDVYSDQGRIDYRKAIEDYMDKMNFDALIYPSWNVKPYKMDSDG
jgi:amidase